MTNIEKSVKELVTESNLRLVGLLAPYQEVRESTAGSATGGEIPEQEQDVPQPPRRRATGVTIREPSSIPQAAAAPSQHGKGKQKLPEYPEPVLKSFDENVMPSEEEFDLYNNITGVLTMSTGWRRSEEIVAKHAEEIKIVEERLTEQLKAVEAKHAEQLKEVEAKHAEQLRAAEEKATKLGEELKQHQDALVKITEIKEKYREASVLNFKEASKL
ncbi:uncharacterized protein LOC133832918 [Humulus lupulus]|uniref:uncharacterized protein LOC133832918 n=1 Tax=Humulus lupulus TaxID=3486 RepID=UPI002B404C8F|nr:uncharacterized protein LOC133832918 [Humulus lupulus]